MMIVGLSMAGEPLLANTFAAAPEVEKNIAVAAMTAVEAFLFSGGLTAILIGGVAAVVLGGVMARGSELNPYLGWTLMALGVVFIVSVALPGAIIAVVIGYPAYWIWLIIAGISLWRRGRSMTT